MREKPKYTQPCNNCGRCCSEALCVVAELNGAIEAPCKFLTEFEGGFICGIVLKDKNGSTKKTLGIGTGCSMADENTTDSEIREFNIQSHIKVFGTMPTERVY